MSAYQEGLCSMEAVQVHAMLVFVRNNVFLKDSRAEQGSEEMIIMMVFIISSIIIQR
jgi:hypothetical protein